MCHDLLLPLPLFSFLSLLPEHYCLQLNEIIISSVICMLGISQPRAASDGSPLPSARAVSITVHRPIYRDDPKFTVMLAVWGQFMDHDVTATALSLGKQTQVSFIKILYKVYLVYCR